MIITEFSIKHNMAVLVACVGILAAGIFTYTTMPRESFPDIEFPLVIVTTVLDGATPTDIEESVTIPLETELDGMEGMKEMRSTSMDSMSMVTIEFMPEVPVEVALSRVRDRVDLAKPNVSSEADEPVVKEFSLNSIPVVIYQLVSTGTASRSELDELAETLEDELRLLPEVLDVWRSGGRERIITIEIYPDRLRYYDLSLEQVQAIVRGTNRNVSAGVAESQSSRIMMRVPGEFRNPADIMDLVIGFTPGGAPVFLRDVGSARYDFKDEESRARLYDFTAADIAGKDGGIRVEPRPSVSLSVTKRTGANIIDMTEKVAALMVAYPYPEGVRAVLSFDQSKFVRIMVGDLENGIATSLVLVLLVIFIGLGFRNSMLVASAIPFSMLASIVIISAMGYTLNNMVLFSLILSLGMLVDNAIVIVENIHRHHSMGAPPARAALLGTSEVGWPVITSTATTIGAFFPLLFWPGIMGQFMGFMPRTVIIVLSCSLLVALVINPTLVAMTAGKRSGGESSFDPEKQRPTYWLARRYEKLLGFALLRPVWVLLTAVALMLLIFTLAVIHGSGVEFFPRIDPDNTVASIKPPEGVSLAESDRVSAVLEGRLFGLPGSGWNEPVANLRFASVVVGLEGVGGSGGRRDGPSGPIQITVEFVDSEYRSEPSTETISEMRRRIDGLDAAENRVAAPLYDAEYEVVRPQGGPPTGKPVAVEIYGDNLNIMARVARDMRGLIEETPGTVKPTDDASIAQPTIEWRVDRARAGMFGLSQPMVSSVLQMAVGGIRVGTFGHGDDEQDILLRFPEEYRLDTNRLRNVTIPTGRGAAVPVVSVAGAELVPGPVTIKRLNKRRVLTVSADVAPEIRADASVRQAFQEKVAGYQFPAGIGHGFGQSDAEQNDAVAFLTRAFFVAVFIIAMVMVLQFNSLLMSSIVMVSVVLSFMGVFAGLVITRSPFNIIMTGIGCISLAGVVVNNAIVMLDAIQRLEKEGQPPREAIVGASMIRLRPILLTAVTTMLGLLPMALKLNFDFRQMRWQYDGGMSQFWQPMASAVIFGLLAATVLTLFVVPSLCLIQARIRERMGVRHP